MSTLDYHPVYLDISDEVNTVLLENGIDLFTELQKDGLPVSQNFGAKPVTEGATDGTKSVEMILMATAAMLPSIAYSINKIINAVSSQAQVLVRQGKYVPLIDAQGNQVFDAHGRPVFQWIEELKYIQKEKPHNSDECATVSLSSSKGLKIEFKPAK